MHLPHGDPLAIKPHERPPSRAEQSILHSEEIKGRLRAGKQRATIGAREKEINELKGWKERYMGKYTAAKALIARLQDRVEDMAKAHREALKKRDQRIRAVEEELARTKELLAARTTELTGAQTFLSTKDQISEAEVLGIVRDINENIFQVAAKLTEEWEKYRPDKSSKFKITKDDIDDLSRTYGPALIHHTLDRDPAAVTFLVQLCLCHLVTQTTSSWRRADEGDLPYVYQNLLASEGQAITARWKSLTHTNLSALPSQIDSITGEVGEVLWITGSFSSTERSSVFVKKVASSGIETIERLATRLESVFMVDIASSDMYLFFGTPLTDFEETRMIREFEPKKGSTRGRREKVAGTTEVGVEKTMYGKKGEHPRTEVLLKAKVVLEGDLTNS